MSSRHDPLLLALLSWAYWAADTELVGKLSRERDFPPDFRSDSYCKILAKIGASLYFPISKDAISKNGFADNWTDKLYLELARMRGVSPRPFWPDNASAALLLTHDVDRVRTTYQHYLTAYRSRGVFALLRAILTKGVPSPDPFRNFPIIREMENKWKLRSTIFVLKEKPRYRRLLKGEIQHVLGVYDPQEISSELEACHKEGAEIGHHLSFDSYKDGDALASEKRYIEQISGTEIAGSRSHYLNYAEDTTELLLNNNFEYDSSMGFNFINGFRCGTAFPFIIGHKAGRYLWEVPLHIMDTAMLWQRSNHGRTWKEIEHGILQIADRVLESGGLLCVNIHQRYFNPSAQPEIMRILEAIIERWKERNGWIPTMSQAVKWWQARALGTAIQGN